MRDGYLRGSLPRTPTARQAEVLAAFVATGETVPQGLTTEQLIYRGRAEGWLVVPSLERLCLTWDARCPRNGVANPANRVANTPISPTQE